MPSKMNPILMYLGLIVILTNGAVGVIAQTDDLNLTDLPNGFRATYKSGRITQTVESSQFDDRSFATTIRNSEGGIVAETTYANDLVTVTISGVAIRFRTDKESIQSGKFDVLSPDDQAKFEAYRKSPESGVLRKFIFAIIYYISVFFA